MIGRDKPPDGSPPSEPGASIGAEAGAAGLRALSTASVCMLNNRVFAIRFFALLAEIPEQAVVVKGSVLLPALYSKQQDAMRMPGSPKPLLQAARQE